MDIDDLKNDWQAAKTSGIQVDVDADTLQRRLESLRKKILKTNIFQTVVMVLTMIFIVLLWSIFREGRSWAFHASIISIEVLIASILTIFWSRTLAKKDLSLNQESSLFVKKSLRQLKRTLMLTKIAIPIYVVLLWISLMLYMYELMSSNMKMFLIASGITTAYVAIVLFFGYRKSRRKQRKTIEPIIAELQEMLKTIEAE